MRRSISRLAPLSPTLRQILQNASSGPTAATQTSIQGWIKSIRAHKSVAFLEITDGTTSETLQAVVKTKGKGKDIDGSGLSASVDG
jgi:asparaginyl-tRNA synthetase